MGIRVAGLCGHLVKVVDGRRVAVALANAVGVKGALLEVAVVEADGQTIAIASLGAHWLEATAEEIHRGRVGLHRVHRVNWVNWLHGVHGVNKVTSLVEHMRMRLVAGRRLSNNLLNLVDDINVVQTMDRQALAAAVKDILGLLQPALIKVDLATVGLAHALASALESTAIARGSVMRVTAVVHGRGRASGNGEDRGNGSSAHNKWMIGLVVESSERGSSR